MMHLYVVFGLKRMSLRSMAKNSVFKTLTARTMSSQSSVDKKEIEKFATASKEWWEEYNSLIALNEVRVPFIRDGILHSTQQSIVGPYPLRGCKIIDVGCGGGILSESLARLGATVTGIDPGEELINVAQGHANSDEEIRERLTYICDTVENVSATRPGAFDAVVCSEVIEHVSDVPSFVKCCVDLSKESGDIFFTTINRTYLSYMLAIVGAEYVLRVVPCGTHDWNKFITPDELKEILQNINCKVVSKEGYMYNPITKRFKFTGKFDSFYALHACK